MNKLRFLTASIILVLLFSMSGPSFGVSARPLAATSPTLGAAESYLILAGSIVTSTGNTTVAGDLGISPGIGPAPHFTGFPPGLVLLPGAIHDADAHAAAAQAANTAAFGVLDQVCDVDYGAVVKELGGLSLTPGVYCANAFVLTGKLTLVGSVGVWIFKSASTLTAMKGSSVVGGDPCNLWWRVGSSATIGVSSRFMGNILALTSIALQTDASLGGRALAQTGAVTMAGNDVSFPICTNAAIQTKMARNSDAAIAGLPNTGGAPIRNEVFPWSLVVVAGFSAMALVLVVRAFRRGHLPKQ